MPEFNIPYGFKPLNPEQLDKRFGPFLSIQDALVHTEGIRVAGLRIGIIEGGKVVTYVVQTDTDVLETEAYSKEEVDEKISESVFLSQASYYPLEDGVTELPVPPLAKDGTPLEVAWVFLKQGVEYTQEDGDLIVGVDGHDNRGQWDGSSWSLLSIGKSPVDQKIILFTGASFTYPDNPWVQIAINKLGGVGYNKAISGENITNTAAKMYNGTLYSFAEMESFEYFFIMHTHNNDVADMTGIQDDYTDYEPVVANEIPGNQAFDYVLKKYRADCYNLKDDPNSKWYGTPYGKPCNIIVTTDWHDARTVYNEAIRELRDRHGFHLLELDKNIGFSKNQVHPVTGEQVSVIYAVDTQVIEGVTYGWHPIRTPENPVQIMIADLVVDFVSRI